MGQDCCGSGFVVSGLGLVLGFGLRVSGLGFRVQGSGFRVYLHGPPRYTLTNINKEPYIHSPKTVV